MNLAFMFNGLFLGISVIVCILGVISLLVLLACKDKSGDSIGRILSQVTSARWILTVLAGISFLLFCASVAIVIIHQRETIDNALAVSMMANLLILIQSVYNMYFNKKPENGNGSNPDVSSSEIKTLEVKPPEQKPNA